MSPDDERHGTYAGAVQHWFDREPLCDACQLAERRYRKRREIRALNGRPATVDATGTRRKVEALHAIGWSRRQIADNAGVSLYTLHSIFAHGSTRVLEATARKVDKAYSALCMTRPDGIYAHRNRLAAQRKGWQPPLAWDDIDDPNEQPCQGGSTRTHRDDVDPVVVERVLAGDRLPTTQAEKVEITRQWADAGRSLAELERLTGWRAARYGTNPRRVA